MQKYAIETCGLTRRFGTQLAVEDLNLLRAGGRSLRLSRAERRG